jgi:hypothetical protein
VYLALALWRGTDLSQLCEELLPTGKEQVPWEKKAAVLVTARLCEPSSELHIAQDWYRRTALADLLQLKDKQVNKHRLYRALDSPATPHDSRTRKRSYPGWKPVTARSVACGCRSAERYRRQLTAKSVYAA